MELGQAAVSFVRHDTARLETAIFGIDLRANRYRNGVSWNLLYPLYMIAFAYVTSHAPSLLGQEASA
jgi:hypothetical protein